MPDASSVVPAPINIEGGTGSSSESGRWETSNGSADHRLWEEAQGLSTWLDKEVRSNESV